jgi:hypothetical protein
VADGRVADFFDECHGYLLGFGHFEGLRNQRIIRRKTEYSAKDRKIGAVPEMGIRERFVVMDRDLFRLHLKKLCCRLS